MCRHGGRGQVESNKRPPTPLLVLFFNFLLLLGDGVAVGTSTSAFGDWSAVVHIVTHQNLTLLTHDDICGMHVKPSQVQRHHCLIYAACVPGVEIDLSRGKALAVFGQFLNTLNKKTKIKPMTACCWHPFFSSGFQFHAVLL